MFFFLFVLFAVFSSFFPWTILTLIFFFSEKWPLFLKVMNYTRNLCFVLFFCLLLKKITFSQFFIYFYVYYFFRISITFVIDNRLDSLFFFLLIFFFVYNNIVWFNIHHYFILFVFFFFLHWILFQEFFYSLACMVSFFMSVLSVCMF